MQQGLPLARTAKGIAGLTIHSYLCGVSPEGLPAVDLPLVFFRHAAT
jgi:hypothetical protein